MYANKQIQFKPQDRKPTEKKRLPAQRKGTKTHAPAPCRKTPGQLKPKGFGALIHIIIVQIIFCAAYHRIEQRPRIWQTQRHQGIVDECFECQLQISLKARFNRHFLVDNMTVNQRIHIRR